MRPPVSRGGFFVLAAALLAAATACSSSAAARKTTTPAPREPTADEIAQQRATAEFEVGRDAMQAGWTGTLDRLETDLATA
jgi:hypothetical protein